MGIFIFWMAMWSFSIGICEHDTKGLRGAKVTAIYFLFWPLLLGCYLRDKLEAV